MRYVYKKEPGSGGPVYVTCLWGMLVSVVLFIYLTFCADLFLIENELDIAIHFAESKALTQNNQSDNKEDRIHIIPNHTPENVYIRADGKLCTKNGTVINKLDITSTMSDAEKKEVETVANVFLNSIISSLNLKNRIHPQDGILVKRCGTDSNVLVTKLVIYEPIYGIKVTANKKNETGEVLEPPFVEEKYDFSISYQIVKWIKYEIPCTNNSISGSIKKTACTSTPKLYNSEEARGSTIEATVSIRINGLQQIFASKESKEFFEKNPEQKQYQVSVTQAYDITLVDFDNRVKE